MDAIIVSESPSVSHARIIELINRPDFYSLFHPNPVHKESDFNLTDKEFEDFIRLREIIKKLDNRNLSKSFVNLASLFG